MKSIIIILFFAVIHINWACSAKEPAAGRQTPMSLTDSSSGSNSEQYANQSESIPYKGIVSKIAAVKTRENKVPDFAWMDGSGKRITFDEFHGTVTLLNFWATWCGPCRKEIPDLEAIHKDYSDKGVKVIGVSVDRGPSVLDEVTSFAKKFNMTYPVVIDNGDLEQIFGNIRAIPTTFIIDKEGKIVERLVGMRSKEVFLQSILPYLQ